MPIYEYKCQKCGTFEVTQRITDKPLIRCPTCKAKVKKLISNTSFQLKGTGWYLTDYARKDKSAAKDANGSKPSADSKSESKSDSKNESSSSTSDKSAPASSSTSSSS
jgi:putative FmdB family regulatory protein